MNTLIRATALTAVPALPAPALADPIIEVLSDGNSPTSLGGYSMTEFDTTGLETTCNGTDIPFGTGNTPGFGVYSSDSCASISRIVIEP